MQNRFNDELPFSIEEFTGNELSEFTRKLSTLLDTEQFERAFTLAHDLSQQFRNEQRGTALLGALMMAQIICEHWRDERKKREPLNSYRM